MANHKNDSGKRITFAQWKNDHERLDTTVHRLGPFGWTWMGYYPMAWSFGRYEVPSEDVRKKYGWSLWYVGRGYGFIEFRWYYD